MENLHPCTVCGALVAGGDLFTTSAGTHAAWHGLMARRLDDLADEAGRYVPPPTYGGRST